MANNLDKPERTMQEAIDDVLAGRINPESLYRITTDDAAEIIESPIEEDALVGFACHWFFVLCKFETVADMREALAQRRDDRQRVLVAPQVRVGPYRADFLVGRTTYGDYIELFAFECDGYEFHGRTQNQIDRDARRDAYFAKQKIKVARFPGHELIRDPQNCVLEFANRYGLNPNPPVVYDNGDDDYLEE